VGHLPQNDIETQNKHSKLVEFVEARNMEINKMISSSLTQSEIHSSGSVDKLNAKVEALDLQLNCALVKSKKRKRFIRLRPIIKSRRYKRWTSYKFI
jgi:hypothetical protein